MDTNYTGEQVGDDAPQQTLPLFWGKALQWARVRADNHGSEKCVAHATAAEKRTMVHVCGETYHT